MVEGVLMTFIGCFGVVFNLISIADICKDNNIYFGLDIESFSFHFYFAFLAARAAQ